MDGEITIGTKLSTDKFDRQIVDLEKKMQKEEDKKILIEAQLDTQNQDLKEARKKTDELADAYQRLKEITSSPIQFRARFGEYQELKSQFGNLQQIETNFNRALSKQDAIQQKAMQTEMRYKEISDRVSEYKQKIESVKIQQQVAEVDRMKDSFKNVGSSIQSSINKVARLALGIFGVRSAYMALRRASSDLASYDTQYATNLEYIRYALTQTIAPVLRYIVSLAATLLGYINAIVQAWFGINIFSRGSADNFAKMKAGASGVAKATKEIKKQLAGFDEINMLTDQSDSGTGGGGGAGGAMPEFDLSKMQGEPPEWLKWIIDHKNEIFSVLAGIATALALIHLGIKPLTALGIGAMVTGLLWTIGALKDYLEAPTWENFGKIIQGIGIFLAGLLGIILGFPGVIIGVVVFIVGTIIKHWDKIKETLQNGIDWLTSKTDWVRENFGIVGEFIYKNIVQTLQDILNWFDMTFVNIKRILDGIIQFVTGVFTGSWEQAWEGIRNIFGGIFNWILNTAVTIINSIFGTAIQISTNTSQTIANIFKSVVNAVLRTIESVLNSPIRTVNRLIGIINGLPRSKYKYITNI